MNGDGWKMKEFLDTKDVADEFFNGGCKYQKVLRLTRAGILPGIKLGKSYVYRKENLEEWARQNFCKKNGTRDK